MIKGLSPLGYLLMSLAKVTPDLPTKNQPGLSNAIDQDPYDGSLTKTKVARTPSTSASSVAGTGSGSGSGSSLAIAVIEAAKQCICSRALSLLMIVR